MKTGAKSREKIDAAERGWDGCDHVDGAGSVQVALCARERRSPEQFPLQPCPPRMRVPASCCACNELSPLDYP